MLVLIVVVVGAGQTIDMDMDFVGACQAGFKADFGSSKIAKELGYGICDLIVSGRRREGKWRCDEGVPRPEKRYSVKKMIEKQSDYDARDTPKRPATWYAWRTEEGELCIAFNALFKDFEQSVVWQVAEDESEWVVWNTYSITSPPHKTRWTKADEVKFGWLNIGPVEPTVEALTKKLDQLVQLKVISSPTIAERPQDPEP